MWLLILEILMCLTTQANSEVMPNQFTCKHFFYKGTEPKGIIPQNAARICQTYNNRAHFATMYDKENRIPIYSAYIHTNGGNGIRSNDWYIEPQLIDRRREKNMIIVSNNATEEEKESQAVSEDYTATDATRYDRGHLSPSMHHNNEESRTATFTLTNIVPQRTILNQGEWNRYETEIMQQFVNGCTTTYVIVGVIRGKNDKKTINNRVKVPSHLWTAACCVNNNNNPMRSLGYIAENDDKPVEDINLADLQRQIKGDTGREVTLFENNCR
ncbi:endonuclease domain-containing 1 protein-like [Polypterus senegalus]|uniref:endonuclease domain-containing 1 protein-like n=1 Tax=Polypterus senegalus TaxID=55291 RepID=UPI0019640DB2|nr:endonuclease domain-containing 1 protein-like [Polypterus senegalus]